MTQTIQEGFSFTLLSHLLGATMLICILGYQILVNFANGHGEVLMSFLVFQLAVLLVLYAHCTVGQALVDESAKVCEAFYNCGWYNMSMIDARSIAICILRSQKSLKLTAGNFGTISLPMLTEVIKNSLGYLSVLRSFLIN